MDLVDWVFDVPDAPEEIKPGGEFLLLLIFLASVGCLAAAVHISKKNKEKELKLPFSFSPGLF